MLKFDFPRNEAPCEQISNVMVQFSTVEPSNDSRDRQTMLYRVCRGQRGGCVMVLPVGQVDRDRYTRSILVTRRTNVFYKRWRTFALKGQVELFRRGVPARFGALQIRRSFQRTFFSGTISPERVFVGKVVSNLATKNEQRILASIDFKSFCCGACFCRGFFSSPLTYTETAVAFKREIRLMFRDVIHFLRQVMRLLCDIRISVIYKCIINECLSLK